MLTTLIRRMSTKKPIQQPKWHKPLAKSSPKLSLYNSLTRTKDEFIPLVPNHISWYCCGPTVYSHSHMGHARNYICTDISRRILQDYFGYHINFVQNVTDIDDKIIIAARHQYLFHQRIVNKYSSLTPELVQEATEYLAAYVAAQFPAFSGDLASDFLPYVNSLDVPLLAVSKPKLPMYVAAATRAHAAVFGNFPLSEFLAAIEETSVPSLDAKFGSSVVDPAVFKKLPAFWENSFNNDMERLNVLPPSVTTRVSEYVPEIITFVDKIIDNGFAYAAKDGSVYFDTVKFDTHKDHDYAKLQPWNKGSLELINDAEGSLSISETSLKRSSADFALWKASKPGEPAWDSKWGPGRPGWHIECSVMASDILGEVIDIHTGGIDLCFPHHDNELAQSEAYFDNKQWINYFMHNGHLHIQGQKMSKSLKNFITIEEALATYSPRQLRLTFAFGAWDKPIDFKDSLIQEVKAYESTISKFFTTVRALNSDERHSVSTGSYVSKKWTQAERTLAEDLKNAQTETHAAFCDSLNAPAVLKIIGDLVSKSNNYIQSTVSGQTELRLEVLVNVTQWIVKIFEIIGIDARKDRLGWSDSDGPANDGTSTKEDIAMPYVKQLSQFRDTVRELAIGKAEVSEFLKASDQLRATLIELGISLDDRPNGGALVKFLNDQEKEDFIQQQLAKEKQAQEKERKKREQAEANAKKEEEKLAKMKIKPSELFQDPELYSEWDEQGIPTKTATGEEVTKSMKKKLMKQFQQQEKLYAEFVKMEKK